MPGNYNNRYMTAVGTLKYNNFTFPAAFNAKIVGIPEYDTADVSAKHIKYVLTVETIIHVTDVFSGLGISGTAETLDTAMRRIRANLLEPGKQLIVSLQGFGNISITPGNITGGLQREVNLGPKPRELSWEPIGANQACRLVWQVEFCVPECADQSQGSSVQNFGRYGAFNWEGTWDIDEEGLTTRTIDGSYELPLSRLDTDPPLTSSRADAYRDYLSLTFKVPAGFQRVVQNYTESANRKVMRFQIVDREVPSEHPWPEFMVKVRLAQSVESEGPAFVKYKVKISGTCTVAAGVPKSLGLLIMTRLIKQRYVAGIQRIETERLDSQQQSKQQRFVAPIPTYLFIEEDVFSRSFRVSFAWWFCADLSVFLNATGMFKPVDTNWERWAASMLQFSTSLPRGYARLGLMSDKEAIVSICNNVSFPEVHETPTTHQHNPYGYSVFSYETPPQQASYLSYDCQLEEVKHKPVSVIQETQETPDPKKDNAVKRVGQDDAYKPGGVADPSESSQSLNKTAKNYLQQHGAGETYYALSGGALRAGYDPQVPRLESIGGRKCYLVDSKVAVKTIRTSAKVPVIAAKWLCLYRIEESMPTKDLTTYSGNAQASARI